MNINEDCYCSRCMKLITSSNKCPYCGFEESYKTRIYYLEEGTLFCNGRFELGAVYDEDDRFIRYSAWDYQEKKPVIVKEYFPKAIVYRNNSCGDNVTVCEEFLEKYYSQIQSLCAEPEKVFKKNNTVYWIEPHPSAKHNSQKSCLE